MPNDFHLTSKIFDPATLAIMEDVFVDENLIQVIIHGHLLVERALAAEVAKKFARPEVIIGKDSRWSFSELARLYVGLYDPQSLDEQALRGLNKLRNMVAHQLEIDGQVVFECLPWSGEHYPEPPDPLDHVKFTIFRLLFTTLGAVDSIRQVDISS